MEKTIFSPGLMAFFARAEWGRVENYQREWKWDPNPTRNARVFGYSAIHSIYLQSKSVICRWLHFPRKLKPNLKPKADADAECKAEAKITESAEYSDDDIPSWSQQVAVRVNSVLKFDSMALLKQIAKLQQMEIRV